MSREIARLYKTLDENIHQRLKNMVYANANITYRAILASTLEVIAEGIRFHRQLTTRHFPDPTNIGDDWAPIPFEDRLLVTLLVPVSLEHRLTGVQRQSRYWVCTITTPIKTPWWYGDVPQQSVSAKNERLAIVRAVSQAMIAKLKLIDTKIVEINERGLE